MQISTKAGQVIELQCGKFEWKLFIRFEEKKELVLLLTDEEVKWLALDFTRRSKEI